MVSVVAARYAKALADVITGDGKQGSAQQLDPAEIVKQLRLVEAMIDGSHDLRSALASPAVVPSKKRAVLGKLLDQSSEGAINVSPQVRNFLYVVIDHRRIHVLKSIIEAFEALADERMGFVRADVSSAQELTDAQRAAMESQLSRLSGKQAKLRFAIDPALIGGAVARLGSTVYDGSVRGQLDKLRAKLESR